MNFKKEATEDLLKKIGVTIKHEDADKDGKALLKVMPSGEYVKRNKPTIIYLC